jgi:hypothetical protein
LFSARKSDDKPLVESKACQYPSLLFKRSVQRTKHPCSNTGKFKTKIKILYKIKTKRKNELSTIIPVLLKKQ